MSVKEWLADGKYLNKLPYTKDNRKAYADENYRLLKIFREDLETEFHLLVHPKAQKLWDLAWDHGHSGGLSQVFFWYDELAELVT